MGISRSPAEVAAKFKKLERGLAAAHRDGVTAAALLITRSVRQELGRAAPGGRLGGVGRRGARISVGFDTPKSVVNPVALVRMRGPAHLIERDTKPHAIAPRRRRSRSGGRRALLVPGVGMRASVQHPGTKGKHPWERGVRAVQRQVLPTIARETDRAIAKAFR